MKKLISFSLAILLSVSVFTMSAFASDTDHVETTAPASTSETAVETKDVLCHRCGHKMHIRMIDGKPDTTTVSVKCNTVVCPHYNAGKYTIDEVYEQVTSTVYLCDNCGHGRPVTMTSLVTKCNFKK